MDFATLDCCCGGVECFVCHSGTAPPAFQVTPSGVLAGTNPICCSGSCGSLNDMPITVPFAFAGSFNPSSAVGGLGTGGDDIGAGAYSACYYQVPIEQCESTDLLRLALYGAADEPARLAVQFFTGAAICAAVGPPFAEARQLALSNGKVDCSQIDKTLTYTRSAFAGDTFICNFKSATVHVLALS